MTFRSGLAPNRHATVSAFDSHIRFVFPAVTVGQDFYASNTGDFARRHGAEDMGALWNFGGQSAIQNHAGHQRAQQNEQATFDELHPGGAHHASRRDDHDNHAANRRNAHPMIPAQQWLDQSTCANHLRDEVKD